VTEVAPEAWLNAVEALQEEGFEYFDWLGCVDEIGRLDCLRVVLVVRNLSNEAEPRMLNCWLPRDKPRIDTVRGVFAGAAWHEREAAELFGVEFVGGERRRLLLNSEFEGTPLRKD
jgi:NADH-quinone oxidoreductase subunit C